MANSFDSILGARQAPRAAKCPEHGDFESRNVFGKVWSKCPACLKAEDDALAAEKARNERAVAEKRHRIMLDQACIPGRFIGCSFDSFVADTEEKQLAVTVARSFVEKFPEASKRGASLIFGGKVGTGKSHLAGAILQALLSPNVRYVTCMDLIRMVRETWRRDSDRSETKVLAYLQSLDLLVIDEVGMQYGTDGEQTILFDILDRRYRELKPVILLTNQNKEGLRDFLGDRIFDRLVEVARWVSFEWDSYRSTARKSK